MQSQKGLHCHTRTHNVWKQRKFQTVIPLEGSLAIKYRASFARDMAYTCMWVSLAQNEYLYGNKAEIVSLTFTIDLHSRDIRETSLIE